MQEFIIIMHQVLYVIIIYFNVSLYKFCPVIVVLFYKYFVYHTFKLMHECIYAVVKNKQPNFVIFFNLVKVKDLSNFTRQY